MAPRDYLRAPQRMWVSGRIPAAPPVAPGIDSSTRCDPNWTVTAAQFWSAINQHLLLNEPELLPSTPDEVKQDSCLSECFVYSSSENLLGWSYVAMLPRQKINAIIPTATQLEGNGSQSSLSEEPRLSPQTSSSPQGWHIKINNHAHSQLGSI